MIISRPNLKTVLVINRYQDIVIMREKYWIQNFEIGKSEGKELRET
jgi:hypothetical protein